MTVVTGDADSQLFPEKQHIVFLNYPVEGVVVGGFAVVVNRSQVREKIHLYL